MSLGNRLTKIEGKLGAKPPVIHRLISFRSVYDPPTEEMRGKVHPEGRIECAVITGVKGPIWKQDSETEEEFRERIQVIADGSSNSPQDRNREHNEELK